MKARYPGRCADGDAIEVGDEIRKAGRGWRHAWHNAPGTHPWKPGDFVELDNYEDWERSEAIREKEAMNAEYAAGIADGERYQMEKRVYGRELADAFQAQDEWNRYWKFGED